MPSITWCEMKTFCAYVFFKVKAEDDEGAWQEAKKILREGGPFSELDVDIEEIDNNEEEDDFDSELDAVAATEETSTKTIPRSWLAERMNANATEDESE